MKNTQAAPGLLDRIRKSRLVPAADLEQLLANSPENLSEAEMPRLLERFVEAGMLTPFQSNRLAAGKYKGFFLGNYVILDEIGSGGMGRVYLAEHTGMRRRVAIKVLSLPVFDDLVARERFVREAQVAALMNHPNIVYVFDLCREGRILYQVMEYVEGVTLQKWVESRGPLPSATAVALTLQIARALQHAMQQGLVHRDVKPANILVDRQGSARLVDLGLVRIETDTDSKLTGKIGQSILGTADYLAPEQAIAPHAVDSRADIYSLGAVLYYLLSGRVLFPDGSVALKLMAHQKKMPRPIEELVPNMPPGLVEVIQKALAKNRADRYQTPQAFGEALAPFAGSPLGPPAELMPKPPAWRPGGSAIDPIGTPHSSTTNPRRLPGESHPAFEGLESRVDSLTDTRPMAQPKTVPLGTLPRPDQTDADSAATPSAVTRQTRPATNPGELPVRSQTVVPFGPPLAGRFPYWPILIWASLGVVLGILLTIGCFLLTKII